MNRRFLALPLSSLALLVAVVVVSCNGASRSTDSDIGDTAYAPPRIPGPTAPPIPPLQTGLSPRSHAPIDRYAPAPPPPFATLPRLVVREGCLVERVKQDPVLPPAYVQTRPDQNASGTGYDRGTRGLDLRGSGAGGGGATAGPAPKKAAQSPMAVESAPRSRMDSLGDISGRAAAPAAPIATGQAVASPLEQPQYEHGHLRREKKLAVAEEAEEARVAPLSAQGPQLPYEEFGSSIYLSNDDTMSLSSAQRVIYAIDQFLPLPLEHIRPHELLNYFSFDTDPVVPGYDFSVRPDIAADPRQPGVYTLALAVRGRPVDKETRRNAALSFVVDRSGSMRQDGRMSYLKQGLERMMSELKAGDIVNLTVFDQKVCSPIEGFVVGRDDPAILRRIIGEIQPRGATDLFAGLTEGYRLAEASYQHNFNNRVVIVTDALANRGETSPNLAGIVSRYYESRQIRLSGVGVGREFNDALLDTLTEKGKGAYVFLGSQAEVDAVFGRRFLSLIETTALDVHFRLHLPRSMKMNAFYGEESSTVKSDVQAVHYFANTSQLFLSDLLSIDGTLHPEDLFAVTIEYSDPETGLPLVEEYVFNVGQVARDSRNLRKARLLMAWVDLLSEITGMRPNGEFGVQGGQWLDGWAHGRCVQGRSDLTRLSAGLEGDPEAQRVLGLWDRFCSRFSPPRNPVRRIPPQQSPDAWPSASGTNR